MYLFEIDFCITVKLVKFFLTVFLLLDSCCDIGSNWSYSRCCLHNYFLSIILECFGYFGNPTFCGCVWPVHFRQLYSSWYGFVYSSKCVRRMENIRFCPAGHRSNFLYMGNYTNLTNFFVPSIRTLYIIHSENKVSHYGHWGKSLKNRIILLQWTHLYIADEMLSLANSKFYIKLFSFFVEAYQIHD